ncbi:hypothetical protein M3Y94_01176700 [Aphelenchoides besseyi]|nr:hypothetical protein M3Y94_01176700 [Aphelenchoides besseyi]
MPQTSEDSATSSTLSLSSSLRTNSERSSRTQLTSLPPPIQQNDPNAFSLTTNHRFGTDNFWLNRLRMHGQPESGIPRMKQFWELTAEKERQEAERCAERHKLQRPYDFPRWRSNDAFTASLVASKQTSALIPLDSRIPEHRAHKINETEAIAEIARRSIQENAVIPGRRRTKSRLSVDDFSDRSGSSSWLSTEEIRASIDHDSIADMRSTRDFFERASRAEDFENQLVPRPFVANNTISVVPLNQVLSVNCNSSQTQSSPLSNDVVYSAPLQSNHHSPLISASSVVQPTNDSRPMSFLEREIFEQQRREEEFRLRQQQLGHLTLEDTFQIWHSGDPTQWDAAISRSVSAIGSRMEIQNGMTNGTN